MAAFVIVISVIVFIHEFGHYITAKLCGVRILTFSIGFGKELFGWNDKSGTRWKFCLLPLGGYVKMFGDSSAASTPDVNLLDEMRDKDKKRAFHFKPLYQKALIVAAGPIANFLLTIAIFIYFIMSNGLPSINSIIGRVIPDSPAQQAGLKAGDRIVMVDGNEISNFNDISYAIYTNLGTPIKIIIERDNKKINFSVTPKITESEDGLGNKIKRPLIGIKSTEIKYEDVGMLRAVSESIDRTYVICKTTLKTIGQLVTGKRDVKELSGPVGIAQLSGKAADKGVNTVIWLIALISANLGLMNLLPIPVLDGGHLLYYAIEAARGRPMAQKMQEYGFRAGFSLLIMLMAFTFINDIRKLIS
ncbi:MAG: RIP metalloprotease RseP [Rickettsiales bacterium]